MRVIGNVSEDNPDLEVLPNGLWDPDGLETPLRRTGQCRAPLSPLEACVLLLNRHGRYCKILLRADRDDAVTRCAEQNRTAQHEIAAVTKERKERNRKAN